MGEHLQQVRLLISLIDFLADARHEWDKLPGRYENEPEYEHGKRYHAFTVTLDLEQAEKWQRMLEELI